MATTDRRPRHDDEPPMRSGSIAGGQRAQRWASTYAAYRRWFEEHDTHPRQGGADPTESTLGEYLVVDRLAGIGPEDLAWAVSFAERNDVRLVRLVEDRAAQRFWFEEITFANRP